MTVRYAPLDEIPGQARARIRLHGPDTRRFLQGTLTANIEALAPGHAVTAALCTVKGKLVSELVVLAGATEQEVHALVPLESASSLAAHFDAHIIMDDVEVEMLGRTAVTVVFGEDDAAATIPGVGSWQTRHPAPGRLYVGESAALTSALAEMTAVDAEGWTAHRIASASPAWGHELEPGFFPPEIGFVYAVSYDKGCFLGQEPLARIHAKGQVNRVMVRVGAARAPSAAVGLRSGDGKDVGRWTSWAGAGGSGRVEGLAIVRRSVAEAGQSVRTDEADPIDVEIRSGPLGDDPGVAGRRRVATVKLGRR